MNTLIIIITSLILGFLLGKYSSKNTIFKNESKGLIKKQTEEKTKNKEKILKLLETQGTITNNQIEQILGVSDATAERYLQELEDEGTIKQVGKTGRDVFYEKI